MTAPRCTCGARFYAWHNPLCAAHPIPIDGSQCSCCGVTINVLSPSAQHVVRAHAASRGVPTEDTAAKEGEQ